MFIGLCLIQFVCFWPFYNLSALLPQFVDEHHGSITEFEVGILMAIFQLGYFPVSLLLGQKIHKFGARSALMYGFTSLAVATAGFAFTSKIENDRQFYWVSILCRLV
jgi:MFS family permease